MKNTNISIYVPVYNGEKTIERCINSVLEQSIKPNNILILNDSSNDNTLKILKNYEGLIHIKSNTNNLGLSHSRNIAVNELKTRYIASVDADVELDKNWLEILYSSILKNDATLAGGRMYEKYINNPFNLWRSLRIGQQWGDKDLNDPSFIFGCNNILDTERIEKKKIYLFEGDYFKTNGEDLEFCKYLKKKNLKLFYSSKAICHHLQNDDAESLSNRYWRYKYYGDGFKKRNFIKTLKNLIRQFKKTIIWTLQDIINFRWRVIVVNFLVFYHFCKIDFKFIKKKIK